MYQFHFLLCSFALDGQNKLAVQVFQFTDGSYLEDQDFWRLSGIQRDVMLLARPKTFIQDIFARALLEENYQNGVLSLDVEIKSTSIKNDKKYILQYQILDKEDNEILANQSDFNLNKSIKKITFNGNILDVIVDIRFESPTCRSRTRLCYRSGGPQRYPHPGIPGLRVRL